MSKKEFGSDPMDIYSKPVNKKMTKLGCLFTMPVRSTPEKPGRALMVVWDEREPLISGFENRYSYTVTFSQPGNQAGNHFHLKKQELFYPLVGEFRVLLRDVKEEDKEEIFLRTRDHQVLYIPSGVVHTVIASSSPAVLSSFAEDHGRKTVNECYSSASEDLTPPKEEKKPWASAHGVSLVTATYPNNQEDEFPYALS